MLFLKTAFIWVGAFVLCMIVSLNTDKMQFIDMICMYIFGIILFISMIYVFKNATQEEKEYITFAKYIKKYTGIDIFGDE